jgi:pyridoxine 5-phosphate synthase
MSRVEYQRLYVNVDHVATIRQARRTTEPDPTLAALECERAGADGITAHLREDRRHMQDADIERLVKTISTVFNLEMACTDEMLAIAERTRPHQVTLVPERREEVTTEGGLAVEASGPWISRSLPRLTAAGIRTSLFIDADEGAIRRAADLGVTAIELHTGKYAAAPDDASSRAALARGASLAASLGLAVHAGHGLTIDNVGFVAAIPEVEELNIGHSIVSQSVFVGIAAAVHLMRVAMTTARAST